MVERLLSLLFLPLNEIPQEPNSFRSNLLEPLCPGSSRSHSLRRRPYSVLGSIQGWFIMEAWTLEPGVQCHSASLKTLLAGNCHALRKSSNSQWLAAHSLTIKLSDHGVEKFPDSSSTEEVVSSSFVVFLSGVGWSATEDKNMFICVCVCVSLSLSLYM